MKTGKKSKLLLFKTVLLSWMLRRQFHSTRIIRMEFCWTSQENKLKMRKILIIDQLLTLKWKLRFPHQSKNKVYINPQAITWISNMNHSIIPNPLKKTAPSTFKHSQICNSCMSKSINSKKWLPLIKKLSLDFKIKTWDFHHYWLNSKIKTIQIIYKQKTLVSKNLNSNKNNRFQDFNKIRNLINKIKKRFQIFKRK